ncbi:MAG: hypothetical protein LBI63_00235 [Candidatus Ancillula sp.]|jgi:hypothetical protein|nr:hypothetical protein [Candidatus Ancillula sp.]
MSDPTNLKATMVPEDYEQAIIDKETYIESLNKAISNDRRSFDTPYMKVLREQFEATASKIIGREYQNEVSSIITSINHLKNALEKNIMKLEAMNTEGVPRKGYSNTLNSSKDIILELQERKEALSMVTESWKARVKMLIGYFNTRTAQYIDILTKGSDIVVDFPILDETYVPEEIKKFSRIDRISDTDKIITEYSKKLESLV